VSSPLDPLSPPAQPLEPRLLTRSVVEPVTPPGAVARSFATLLPLGTFTRAQTAKLPSESIVELATLVHFRCLRSSTLTLPEAPGLA
jgi:hypothetical protein